jgi:hypothetical protein
MSGRSREQRSAMRMQAMALIAWAAGATALAAGLYPVPAAALLAFLIGIVMVGTMRTSLAAGLVGAGLAYVPFVFADLTLAPVGAPASDLASAVHMAASALHQLDIAAGLALGATLLLTSVGVADVTSTVISRLPGEALAGGPIVHDRRDGLRRAEWELGRAAEFQHPVALALVGVDTDVNVRPGPTVWALAELLLASGGRFDVVAAYGSRELLMVLPERTAEDAGEHAGQLCRLGSERLGCPVRIALAGFPGQGATLAQLLVALEADLATIRTAGGMVHIGGSAVEPEPEAAPPVLALPSARTAPDATAEAS